MTKYLAIFLSLCLLSGCKGKDAAESGAAPAHEQPSHQADHAEPGTLHIESEMLRDLKITTAPVDEFSNTRSGHPSTFASPTARIFH